MGDPDGNIISGEAGMTDANSLRLAWEWEDNEDNKEENDHRPFKATLHGIPPSSSIFHFHYLALNAIT